MTDTDNIRRLQRIRLASTLCLIALTKCWHLSGATAQAVRGIVSIIVATLAIASTAIQAQNASDSPSAPLCATDMTGNGSSSLASNTVETCTVSSDISAEWMQLEGRIEAVQQVTLATQVAGTVQKLNAHAGQRVRQGQLLLRVDARAAIATTRATQAQVQAIDAQLAVAQKHLARQRQLYEKNFISQAALEQAQAQADALAAQAKAQRAQTRAADSQTDYYNIRAPFDGVVAAVYAELGDMAMPGRAVLQLYRADRLRATVHVPAAVAARLRNMDAGAQQSNLQVRVNGKTLRVIRVRILPVADAASNTVEVRCELDVEAIRQAGALPGGFARIGIRDIAAAHAQMREQKRVQQHRLPPSVWIPTTALVQRAQMHAVYVIRPNGSTVLRYVRPGKQEAGRVAIVSGLDAGEVISLNPDKAAAQSLPATATEATD